MIYIEIYTKKNCPYCKQAKILLIKKSLDFKEIIINDDEKKNMMHQRSGKKTVPQVFINGNHIGGSDDLILFDKEGKLDEIIASNKYLPN